MPEYRTAAQWREAAKRLHTLQNRAELYAGDLEAAGWPGGLEGIAGVLGSLTFENALAELELTLDELNATLRASGQRG